MALMALRSNGASSSFFLCLSLLVLTGVGGKHVVFEDSQPNWCADSNVVESGFYASFFIHDFMGYDVANSAQEYDSMVYFTCKGFRSASEVEFGPSWGFRSTLVESGFYALNSNLCFRDQNITHGAQDCDTMVCLVEEDYLGFLSAVSDATFCEYDHFALLDHLEDGAYTLVVTTSLGTKQRDSQGKRSFGVNPDSYVLLLCFVSNVLYAKWKKDNVLRLITKSSDWMAFGNSRRKGCSQGLAAGIFFWSILFGLCAPALGVTCLSCFDGNEGCAGGAACLFSTRTAANLAALTVAGGAAINVASLVPSSYLRHLPTQVLRTLAAIARVPAAGGPPDLGAMSLTELQECVASGRIDINAYKGELSTRLADPATAAAQVTRISAMLLAIQNNTVTINNRVIEGISSYGVLGYLVAAASLIVNSGKRTYSSGTASTGGSSSSGGTSLSIRVPTSGSQFAELLMVWQTLAHAVGAANFLATVPFLQQVVWDGISTLGLLWEQAYCLFIIYLEAIEDSRGVLNLANVFAAGAQDTRLKAANQRYSRMFCQTCDDQDDKDKEKDKGANKWNNRDSPNANGICKTYNFRDAEHPKKHLFKDGTCKFRHVCIQWVTGKGAGGMCEGNHPKYSCNNPNKTNTKPTQ